MKLKRVLLKRQFLLTINKNCCLRIIIIIIIIIII